MSRRKKEENVCYLCFQKGHYATECKEEIVVRKNKKARKRGRPQIFRKNKKNNNSFVSKLHNDRNLTNFIRNLYDQHDISLLKRLLLKSAKYSYYGDTTPIVLNSKEAEEIVNHFLNAKNISKSDLAFDILYQSKYGISYGIGIKTFIFLSLSLQKISEHDEEKPQQRFKGTELIKKIVELHNGRILSACEKYNISNDNCYYIIICRDLDEWCLGVDKMNIIDIDKLLITGQTNKGISFTDGENDYNYNFAKSVLQRNFSEALVFDKINVGRFRNKTYIEKLSEIKEDL